MNCSRFETLLSEFMEQNLDPRVREAADRHLETCAACRELVADVQLLVDDLAHFPEVEVPDTLVPEILRKTSGIPRETSFWRDLVMPAVRPFLTQRYAFATVMIFAFLSFAVNVMGPGFSASSFSPSSLMARADRLSSQVYLTWKEFNDVKSRWSEEFRLFKEDLFGRLDYHLITMLFESYQASLEEENSIPTAEETKPNRETDEIEENDHEQ